MTQISCTCKRLSEAAHGNLWTKLHQRLEFLQDSYDVLNLHSVCQQLVLHMLTSEQKEIRRCISGDIFSMAVEDKFLNNIIKQVT